MPAPVLPYDRRTRDEHGVWLDWFVDFRIRENQSPAKHPPLARRCSFNVQAEQAVPRDGGWTASVVRKIRQGIKETMRHKGWGLAPHDRRDIRLRATAEAGAIVSGLRAEHPQVDDALQARAYGIARKIAARRIADAFAARAKAERRREEVRLHEEVAERTTSAWGRVPEWLLVMAIDTRMQTGDAITADARVEFGEAWPFAWDSEWCSIVEPIRDSAARALSGRTSLVLRYLRGALPDELARTASRVIREGRKCHILDDRVVRPLDLIPQRLAIVWLAARGETRGRTYGAALDHEISAFRRTLGRFPRDVSQESRSPADSTGGNREEAPMLSSSSSSIVAAPIVPAPMETSP